MKPAAASCQAASLPLTGGAEAPSLSELFLDCTAEAVEALAVVTDSSGSGDLGNVPRILRVHRSNACDAGVLEIADDVAASDEVETFGIIGDAPRLGWARPMPLSSRSMFSPSVDPEGSAPYRGLWLLGPLLPATVVHGVGGGGAVR